MQKLTKLQIINDTIAHFNPGNRAIDIHGTCRYCASDGKKCAVGRYMGPENLPGVFTGCLKQEGKIQYYPRTFSRNVPGGLQCVCIEDVLIPEARGHNWSFWKDLQNLHDQNVNWLEDGLSPVGKRELTRMKYNWAELD